jgi:hypothetical protein
MKWRIESERTDKLFSSQTDFQLSNLATISRPFHTNLLVFSSPPDYKLTKLPYKLSERAT